APISQPFPVPWVPPPINQTSVPLAFTFWAPESSRHIFIISPFGWWIPISYNGLLSELSQPAKATSQDSGMGSKSSTSAKSLLLLFALICTPLVVKFVCRFPLSSPVPQTGTGLTQLNRMDQRLGLLFSRQ